uniref:cytoplasmic tRNA 2-thiolation protein 2 n=1 Tax=Maylandia zebra TaxID=106582 RepID=UPI000D320181|nr:cytoplasmic tRNA 2-thiolation protein 2-like [Maylandia zebra]
MCQVEEDYRGEMERAAAPSVSKKCVKCKEAPAALVIRAGDAYCRLCFKDFFIHKFKAVLGKNRIIFPGEKVLLAVSGGPSSCSMLRQVQEGLSQKANKKLRFVPGVAFIDEGAAIGQSVEERQRTVAELQAVFQATGFPFYILPLEQVLDLPASVVATNPSPSEQPASAYKAAVHHFVETDCSNFPRPQEPKKTLLPRVQESHTLMLQQLLGSVKTLTAREELLNTLRQHLLVHTARTEGYSKLMLGDSCTRLAVKLLTSISLGRGAQLAQDTGFSDSRYGDIILVRPMRDYSAKEVAYYNHLFTVPYVVIPSVDTKTVDKASIQRLTESFVTKLQTDFPSTVSTIYRTSEKLQTACRKRSGADGCDRCLLCLCSLDTAVEAASASRPRSYQISCPGPSVCEAALLKPEARAREAGVAASHRTVLFLCRRRGCGRAGSDGGCCSSAKLPETTRLKSLLCYSCALTVRDMSTVNHLPQYILSEAQRRQRRSQMREEISDFLLDDGDEGN